MSRTLLKLALAALAGMALAGCSGNSSTTGGSSGSTGTSGNVDAGPQYVVEIDIDDHGLKALWDAQAPNLKRMIREGTLAYTRVIVPTHSNESNMALVTGAYPDVHNVPTNSYLERDNNYKQGFSLGSLGLGDYVFWDHNPLNDGTWGDGGIIVPHHVESVWTAANPLGPTTYVGTLPPWEVGAQSVHFPDNGVSLYGIPVTASSASNLLKGLFHYPADYFSKVSIDGPPDAGETVNHFTIRDAAEVWKAAAADGGAPPRYMFVWAFIALDDDPTSSFGADGPELAKVVDDYDDAIGDLLSAIEASPYKGRVNILFTLDHGKTNATNQCALGSKAGDNQQLSTLVASQGGPEVNQLNYQILNEDGDALIWAVAPDAGTAAGYTAQETIAHKLVDLVQSGQLIGVDTTRTITWDGYRGTRRMHDYRIEGPNSADLIVFPQDNWTLNQVTAATDGGLTDGGPGPIDPVLHPNPYGRHGGFSEDELYVPLIMWGPSFKQGVVLPHPVDHADVAPTAMKILGAEIGTAEGAPILDAFAGDPGETVPDPSDMTTTKTDALTEAGFHGSTALSGTPASQVVIVDLEGVSFDEAFTDATTRAHLPNLNALAGQGVSFEMAWNRYRYLAENRYDMLVGGLPVLDANGNWVPTVESDPAQTGAPGRGLLLEPTQPASIPNPAGVAAWQGTATWASDTVLSAAQRAGFAAGVFGQTGLLTAHLDTTGATVTATSDTGAAAALQSFIQANSKALAVVALGTSRTSDRHSSAALSELDALDGELKAIHDAAPNATFIITSSNGADIDDPASTFYGVQAARHVPLVVVGGPARSGVITGQPATAADIPATALFALGQSGRTDFVEGTWIAGAADSDAGIPQPVPADATAGHVLARAFDLK